MKDLQKKAREYAKRGYIGIPDHADGLETGFISGYTKRNDEVIAEIDKMRGELDDEPESSSIKSIKNNGGWQALTQLKQRLQ